MFAVGLSYIAFIMLRYVLSIPAFWRVFYHKWMLNFVKGFLCSFPGSSESENSAYTVGDLGLIPGLGRSPGEGNGNPLWYSCLEKSMDRGAW